ncbi:MAG: amidohydrolase family protein [Burkholderiaceae bacterium]
MIADAPAAIIDAHHHFWRLKEGHFPWLQDAYDPDAFFLGDYADLCADFDVDTYLRRTAGYAIKATVHIEAERARDESEAETQWLHAEHAKNSGFPAAVVAHVDFAAKDIEQALARQAAYPLVRGIRCKPRTSSSPDISIRGQAGTLQDDAWLQGLSLLERHRYSWDLRVPFWHLAEAAETAAMFPNIPIALNHAGLPWDRSKAGLEHWRRGMAALARCEQVYVKLSELGLRDANWNIAENASIIRETIDIFGWERCMFASNLPVSGLNVDFPTLIDTVRHGLGGLPDEAQTAIWSGNAERFYRISL